MEDLIDFDKWISDYKPSDPEYVAVFDSQTGAVISVGPSHAFENEKNKITLDQETAESIIEGKIKIGACFVDLIDNVLQMSEVKNVFKIDDVLHRIISTKYFSVADPDIYLTHDPKKDILKIELSKEFGGTKKPKVLRSPRKILWDGDTEMNFLITDYNDPNLIFDMYSVKINELIGKSKIIKDFSYKQFSVYTRRLFKNYVIQYK
jgi:hypothetical protein